MFLDECIIRKKVIENPYIESDLTVLSKSHVLVHISDILLEVVVLYQIRTYPRSAKFIQKKKKPNKQRKKEMY
jgi:hypothetical protein